ncbi:MAG: START domain-containing protein [Bacteroidia bacterium]|jgi:ribosome-associated toxin RatA of RatAB toxin-antitoxin module|nr:START domain-containing protein [Bacteroidia bacterium]
MKQPEKVLGTFLLYFVLTGFQHQQKWKLVKNSQGIQIYTSSSPEFPVKGIRAELELETDMRTLLQVIMEVEKYPEWVYACKETSIIKKGTNEVLFYYVTDAPWPVSDRDQVSQFNLTHKADGVVEIQSHTVDGIVKENEDRIRIKQSKAFWRFTPIGANKIKGEYQLFFNPAGLVPAWLINLFVTEGPYQTFIEMRKRLKKK